MKPPKREWQHIYSVRWLAEMVRSGFLRPNSIIIISPAPEYRSVLYVDISYSCLPYSYDPIVLLVKSVHQLEELLLTGNHFHPGSPFYILVKKMVQYFM